jgi:hypothetical protein
LSARHKLNAAHVGGGLIIAALIAARFASMTVFIAVAALLLLGMLYTGSIRLGR